LSIYAKLFVLLRKSPIFTEIIFSMDALTQKAYLVGVHRHSYRAGEVAEIIAVKWAKPTGHDWRLVYEVQFFDGDTDLIPYLDVEGGNAVIISDLELSQGKIPEVCQ